MNDILIKWKAGYSEISQTEKDNQPLSNLAYMWNLKTKPKPKPKLTDTEQIDGCQRQVVGNEKIGIT